MKNFGSQSSSSADIAIGNLLKYIRIMEGLSIRSCAGLSSVAPGTVQKFENGSTKLSPKYYWFIQQYAGGVEKEILRDLIIRRSLESYNLNYPIAHSLKPYVNFVRIVDLYNQDVSIKEIASRLCIGTQATTLAINKYKSRKALHR